jgi:hypothetical protein
VFQRKKYFSAMTTISGLQLGSTVVFLKKVKVDSVIGYGTIDQIKKLAYMDEKERDICEQMDCTILLKFAKLKNLGAPNQ